MQEWIDRDEDSILGRISLLDNLKNANKHDNANKMKFARMYYTLISTMMSWGSISIKIYFKNQIRMVKFSRFFEANVRWYICKEKESLNILLISWKTEKNPFYLMSLTLKYLFPNLNFPIFTFLKESTL
jgi:hypothetical protein